jgi:hypothetical protein
MNFGFFKWLLFAVLILHHMSSFITFFKWLLFTVLILHHMSSFITFFKWLLFTVLILHHMSSFITFFKWLLFTVLILHHMSSFITFFKWLLFTVLILHHMSSFITAGLDKTFWVRNNVVSTALGVRVYAYTDAPYTWGFGQYKANCKPWKGSCVADTKKIPYGFT